MDLFSVYVNWLDNAGKQHELRFNCTKAQVATQVDSVLNNDIGPQFSQSIQITIQDMGPIRGPLA